MKPMVRVKDKKIAINLNILLSKSWREAGPIKKLYTEIVKDQLEGFEIETPVVVSYQVFKPTRRRLDKMNVCAMTSKYLLDAVSTYGCWEDDSDDYVKTETLLPTIHDKNNPRVEVIFRTIKE